MGPVRGTVWAELAREALQSLRAQGRRSLLALLGVMIGSAAIVALLSFAHIARIEVMSRFQQLGVDTVQINADVAGLAWVSTTHLERALSDAGHVEMVAPMAVHRASVQKGSQSVMPAVVAMSPRALQLLSLPITQGRSLGVADGCNGAVMVGSEVAKNLKAAIGDRVFVQGYGFSVVGILGPYPAQALNPFTPDEAVLIGEGCARRIMPRDGYSHVLVRLGEMTDSADWAAATQVRLTKLGALAEVKTPRDIIAAMDSQLSLMTAILVAIGSVSLLVGGVGVMNVMLMTVMERRREIGLRAALGATPSEIVFIFIVEAVALSLGGGLLGALVGLGLTALGCLFLPFGFAFDPWVLLWGTGIAAGVGLVFGIHPAISASRILPVEALRAD